jgi:hypothetical protein
MESNLYKYLMTFYQDVYHVPQIICLELNITRIKNIMIGDEMFGSANGRTYKSSYISALYEHKRGRNKQLYYGQVQYYFQHRATIRTKMIPRTQEQMNECKMTDEEDEKDLKRSDRWCPYTKQIKTHTLAFVKWYREANIDAINIGSFKANTCTLQTSAEKADAIIPIHGITGRIIQYKKQKNAQTFYAIPIPRKMHA